MSATEAASGATATVPDAILIATRMELPIPISRLWDGLVFYEQIDAPPPLYLRLLLPIPVRTEGRKARVGDDVRCVYESGHLLKRVTQIDRYCHYGFKVVEQKLDIGGVSLLGGCYALKELSTDRTEVVVTTRYLSSRRPRWFWGPMEQAVGHMFHRYLLAAIGREVVSRNV